MMKYKLKETLIALLFFLQGAAYANSNIQFAYIDPLTKVFKETAFFIEDDAIAHVARGEVATFQFAFRSSLPVSGLKVDVSDISLYAEALPAAKIGYVEYVQNGRNTPNPSRDRLNPMSGLYPDPILDYHSGKLRAQETQPIWISVNIPTDVKPGNYNGTITVTGKSGKKKFNVTNEINIQVYPVTIEKTNLWITNWFSLDKFDYMNNGDEVIKYSPLWWELTRELVKNMADYKQNMALLSPLNLAEYKIDGDDYEIDFTRFNELVELFIEEGVVGRIEGGHIGSRESHWSSPFRVLIPVKKEEKIEFEKFEIGNPKAISFYTRFFNELKKNLSEMGWTDIYMQHIADEPIDANFESYVEISRFVKEHFAGVSIVEACHTRNLEDMVDVWVPQLNFLADDYNFYDEQQKQGEEAWFYTCLGPQGEFANRFIELPLLKTRILHWINYKYKIPGYLHWGLNHWRGDVFKETSGIIVESGNVLPGGDAWIVYPGYKKVYPSIRQEAMRDGIFDYELLRMLEEKYPDKAKELARQVVYRFDLYDMNVDAFRDKRKKILELLSE